MKGLKPVKDIYEYPKPYQNSRSASGCYGKYIRFSKKLGIKMFDMDDTSLHSIHIEIKNIKYAYKKGVGPKFHRLVRIIKKGGRGYGEFLDYGIVMEHLTGKHKPFGDKKEIAIKKELKKKGIYFRDTHTGNLVFYPDGSYKICDFTPNYFRIIK